VRGLDVSNPRPTDRFRTRTPCPLCGPDSGSGGPAVSAGTINSVVDRLNRLLLALTHVGPWESLVCLSVSSRSWEGTIGGVVVGTTPDTRRRQPVWSRQFGIHPNWAEKGSVQAWMGSALGQGGVQGVGPGGECVAFFGRQERVVASHQGVGQPVGFLDQGPVGVRNSGEFLVASGAGSAAYPA